MEKAMMLPVVKPMVTCLSDGGFALPGPTTSTATLMFQLLCCSVTP
jgi:hypothetical protein